MILTRLKEFADSQMTLPPSMYGNVPIRWLIELDEQANFKGLTPLGGNDKSDKRGQAFIAPTLVRSSGISPKLLADNAEYVLGIAREKSKPERVADAHAQFKKLVKSCAQQTGDESLSVITKFLDNLDAKAIDLPEDFDASMMMSFRVHLSSKSVIPADARENLRNIEAFWAEYTANQELPIMTCLVTGEERRVEQRLPEKIKGIPDGQTAGTSLVSANAEAFTSYGLANSLTSPISREAGEKFAKAINYLINKDDQHFYMGPLVYIFWLKCGGRLPAIGTLLEPKPQEVKNLLASAYSANEARAIKDNTFYALALSASGGRAVVRDWLETSIPVVEANLKRWFLAQQIVDTYGQLSNPLGIRALTYAAYRDADKEMAPNVPSKLINAALKGERIPPELLVKAVNRNRAEGDVTRPRAALIKLVLSYLFFGHKGVNMSDMQTLNPSPPFEPADNVAYHCGRLLAELEAAQRAALGDINANLTDRYFGSASSTPSKVFAVLLRGSRAHLGNLRKNKPATQNAIERRLEDIMRNIPTFPNTLTMQQQGLFALGYYHQRADDRAAAIAAKEAREAKKRRRK